MKILPAVKYQLYDFRKPFIVYYVVIYLLFAFVGFSMLSLTVQGTEVTSSGMEMASAIFLLVAGLNSYKSSFKFFLVNGVSRKTQFFSFIAAILPVAALMSLIDNINAFIFSRAVNYVPLYYQIYGIRYTGQTPLLYAESFFWSSLLYALMAMIGYLITIAYYRMSKELKLLVSIGIPAFLFVILPILDSKLFNHQLGGWIVDFIAKLMGFKDGFNPYIAMLSFLVSFALFGGLSYLLSKRSVVKEYAKT